MVCSTPDESRKRTIDFKLDGYLDPLAPALTAPQDLTVGPNAREEKARDAGAKDLDAGEPALEICVDAAVDCVWRNFRGASRALTQFYDAMLEPSGLRVTQVSLLVGLYLSGGAGGATMSRLARDLVIDRTTLTRNLKPLARRGLVAIERGSDRRTRRVALTPEGRAALAAALPLWRKAQERVLASLGEPRWSRLFNEIAATVDAARDAAPSVRLNSSRLPPI